MSHSSVAIVLSVEKGSLEHQAVLLVESLRRFGGPASDLPVYAISPRPTRAPGADCLASLRRLGVTTIVEPLVDESEAYGTLARLGACVWAEEHLAHPTIVSLDNDMLIVRPPDFSLGRADMVARPVDCKGMCTCGDGDATDPYWRETATACGVSYDAIPWVETTVDRRRVKASYNGGMVVVRRRLGLFREASRMFAILRGHDLAPRARGAIEIIASTGSVGPEASRWWGAAQAVLSLAATRLGARVEIAPPTYNVPVHLAEEAMAFGRALASTDAVLVHYHWLLDEGRFHPDGVIPGGVALPADLLPADLLPAPVGAWLARRVPLGRRVSGDDDPPVTAHA